MLLALRREGRLQARDASVEIGPLSASRRDREEGRERLNGFGEALGRTVAGWGAAWPLGERVSEQVCLKFI